MNRTIMAGLATTASLLSLGTMTVFGQVSLPIRNQADLREYALKLVNHGNRIVTSPSMDWNYPGRLTEVYASGTNAESVIDQLVGSQLQYKLTNPNDKITGYLWAYDRHGNGLFFGSAEYKQADVSGRNPPHYRMSLQRVPLLNNAQSAAVLALDPDGITANQYPLEIRNGEVLFDPWMAGALNGILAVSFGDGSSLSYNVWDPVAYSGGVTTDVAAYSIDGHYVIDAGVCPPGFTCTALVKIVESYNLPTVLFRNSSDAIGAVSIDVMGLVQLPDGRLYFERPTAVTVTPEGKDAGFQYRLSSDRATTLNLGIGQFRMKFDWVNFGNKVYLYTGPRDGGRG